MRMFLIALVIILTSGKLLYAQQTKTESEILSPSVTEKTFDDAVRNTYFQSLPVQRAYRYKDVTGTYYLALCESRDEIKADDTVHYKIKAIFLQLSTTGGFTKTGELNDFRNSHDPKEGVETSNWFWTKFCELKDLDNDGTIDPLLVYGTNGMNGYDDGRVKIVLYYKGQKAAIRCQNSVMDEGRNIQVDATFYTLPMAVQQHVRKLMHTLAEKDLIIYPTDYEKGMNKKQTQIY
ncbi:M949_RS01915 family surface polysaccharide biosynthesis protein [Chitinophaga pinensis]|uniref:Uncharacterized protein n=1 Tax=Chitinophaga pinensis TaxID=79329 RepID=A0A5C6LN12_9BACT|nr:hypothetical protein [Chitinophaga pinensis]TWV96860.1 hypothetical protein FEF09_22475 [Chitinophaga pinensis]